LKLPTVTGMALLQGDGEGEWARSADRAVAGRAKRRGGRQVGQRVASKMELNGVIVPSFWCEPLEEVNAD
jgi:hypothetical protein